MFVFDEYLSVMEEGTDYKQMLHHYTNAKKILSAERLAHAKETSKLEDAASKCLKKLKET